MRHGALTRALSTSVPGPAGSWPVIVGSFEAGKPASSSAADARRLLVHVHYDVEPAHREDGWAHDPFLLVQRDGKLRGRVGGKADVCAWLGVIHAFRECDCPLPVAIDLVVDGGARSGSPDLGAALRSLKEHLAEHSVGGRGDGRSGMAFVVCGSSLPRNEEEDAGGAVVLGARGLLQVQVSVQQRALPAHAAYMGPGACDAGVILAALFQRLTTLTKAASGDDEDARCGGLPGWLHAVAAASGGALEPAQCDVEQCREMASTYGTPADLEGQADGSGGGDDEQALWAALQSPLFDSGAGGTAELREGDEGVKSLLVKRWLLPCVGVHSIAAGPADSGGSGRVGESAPGWWDAGGGGWRGGGDGVPRQQPRVGGGELGRCACGGVSVRLTGQITCAQARSGMESFLQQELSTLGVTGLAVSVETVREWEAVHVCIDEVSRHPAASSLASATGISTTAPVAAPSLLLALARTLARSLNLSLSPSSSLNLSLSPSCSTSRAVNLSRCCSRSHILDRSLSLALYLLSWLLPTTRKPAVLLLRLSNKVVAIRSSLTKKLSLVS